MKAQHGRTPTDAELADARRSGKLAAAQGFPPGVCPHDPSHADQQTLARVWLQTYADARSDDVAASDQKEA